MKENKILAIIPARAGSKGIKDKNIVLINKKPLISYTIKEAISSNLFDKIIVSTDSKKIADVAIKYGAEVPFLRPKNLAKDTSKTIDAVIYTIEKLRKEGLFFDVVVLLQPTSPLRKAKDIIEAYNLFTKTKKDVLSINKIDVNPFLIRKINNSTLKKIINKTSTLRRQELPIYYSVNGAIYINKISRLNKYTSFNDNPVGYIMDSKASLDIDTKNDLDIFKNIMGE